MRQLDEQSGVTSVTGVRSETSCGAVVQGTTWGTNNHMSREYPNDSGGASRFFETFEHEPPFVYVAKASRAERDEGISGETKTRRAVQYGNKKQRACNVCGSKTGPHKEGQLWPTCGHEDWTWVEQLDEGHKGGNAKNTHPTVKPTKLMRYLVRLVTPKGGTVLDPFSGSGSTLLAALLEGAKFVGIEREEEYVHIAEERIQHHARIEMGRQSEEAVFDLLAELEQEF